jgi:predicted metal-binding membrane protein
VNASGLSGSQAVALRRGERRLVVSAAVGTCALAWIGLAAAGHGTAPVPAVVRPAAAHPTGAVGLLAAVAIWWLMMVAMMLPSTLPWLTALAALTRGRGAGGLRPGAVVAFAIGYFGVWLLFSAVAALAQVALHDAGLMRANHALAAPIGGVVLVTAGLYQATPVKSACLERCRNPLGFFLRRWRDGPRGAVGMGVAHGVFCLGCCWALMVLGFALGLMNLAWMAVLTVLVTVENVAVGGPLWGRVAGVGLVVWGMALLGSGG